VCWLFGEVRPSFDSSFDVTIYEGKAGTFSPLSKKNRDAYTNIILTLHGKYTTMKETRKDRCYILLDLQDSDGSS
jgi:hypothetical protein